MYIEGIKQEIKGSLSCDLSLRYAASRILGKGTSESPPCRGGGWSKSPLAIGCDQVSPGWGPTQCMYIWESHPCATCWGSVLLFVIFRGAQLPARCAQNGSCSGDKWTDVEDKAPLDSPLPLLDPFGHQSLSLGQHEARNARTPCGAGRKPRHGWISPSGAPRGLPSHPFPISSRSPSRHPARPPGPLHGAIHQVSGLRERIKCCKHPDLCVWLAEPCL